MKDFIPKGTGNSRYLKSSISAGTTWSDFLAMLRNGTLPIDLNGMNDAGIEQRGTPLSKETLLSDATAALFGLSGNNAIPENVFDSLSPLFLHWWSRRLFRIAESRDAIGTNNNAVSLATYYYSSSYRVTVDRKVELVNPSSITVAANQAATVQAALRGKFFISGSASLYYTGTQVTTNSAPLRYLSPTGTLTYYTSGSTKYYTSTGAYFVHVDIEEGAADSVSSSLRNAYPDGDVSGDYLYSYEGIPINFLLESQKVKVFVDGYVGTGTNGADNPTVLTFPFTPGIWGVVSTYASSSYNNALGIPWGAKKIAFGNSAVTEVTYREKEVSFYVTGTTTTTPGYQMNMNGAQYYYVGISTNSP